MSLLNFFEANTITIPQFRMKMIPPVVHGIIIIVILVCIYSVDRVWSVDRTAVSKKYCSEFVVVRVYTWRIRIITYWKRR